MPRAPRHPQGKYWLLTIPHQHFVPYLPPGVTYIRGQLETGAENGFLHWQVLACFNNRVRLSAVKHVFGEQAHCELSRSEAANLYVWKEETRVAGTQFELGALPLNRNNPDDWKRVKQLAKEGKLEDIPEDIYIRFYRTLKTIKRDFMVAPANLENVCGVWIHGPPGVGKSHKARQDYPNAYLKPCNKWWDGYQEHENVILDDFDKNHECLGHHLKIWTDKYSFIAETKGGAMQIRPKKVVVTSNYTIDQIFGTDGVLTAALQRRFHVIYVPLPLF